MLNIILVQYGSIFTATGDVYLLCKIVVKTVIGCKLENRPDAFLTYVMYLKF